MCSCHELVQNGGLRRIEREYFHTRYFCYVNARLCSRIWMCVCESSILASAATANKVGYIYVWYGYKIKRQRREELSTFGYVIVCEWSIGRVGIQKLSSLFGGAEGKDVGGGGGGGWCYAKINSTFWFHNNSEYHNYSHNLNVSAAHQRAAVLPS